MPINENDDRTDLPDLKHDSMEFAAPADGDDPLDTNEDPLLDEDITAEELDELNDEPAVEAATKAVAVADLATDEDRLPAEDWTDDFGKDDPVVTDDDAEEPTDEPYPGV